MNAVKQLAGHIKSSHKNLKKTREKNENEISKNARKLTDYDENINNFIDWSNIFIKIFE